MKKLLSILLLLLSIASTAFSQNLKKELDSLLNKHVAKGQLHGCVAYVQQGDKVLHFQSYGLKNIEQNKKMENDAIFRIASMSKILVTAGALKLYEDGKFLLDDPVKKYIPQFANLKVMQKIGTDSCKLVGLKRDVTIRDLCRHTAGFGDNNSKDSVRAISIIQKVETAETVDEYLTALCQVPLRHQPGSKWVYGNETKLLGLLIEKITHKNLHDYLTEALFVPLGMSSTGFYVMPKNMARFSSYYLYENGKQTLMDNAPTSRQYFQLPAICNGSGGIVSSAQDLANFYNMILNYGNFKGKQILRPQTVELLISNQIATINDRGWAVSGFGFGVGVNQGRLPIKDLLVSEIDNNNGKTKSIFWQGAPFNTRFLIDFDKQLISIFLTQNAPWRHLDLMSKFEGIVNKNIN